MSLKSKYQDFIFGNNIPTCKESLNELRKQQVIDEGVHYLTHGEYSKKADLG